jgi:hypothetical protein
MLLRIENAYFSKSTKYTTKNPRIQFEAHSHSVQKYLLSENKIKKKDKISLISVYFQKSNYNTGNWILFRTACIFERGYRG